MGRSALRVLVNPGTRRGRRGPNWNVPSATPRPAGQACNASFKIRETTGITKGRSALRALVGLAIPSEKHHMLREHARTGPACTRLILVERNAAQCNANLEINSGRTAKQNGRHKAWSSEWSVVLCFVPQVATRQSRRRPPGGLRLTQRC